MVIKKYKHFVELVRPYNAMTIVVAFCIGYFFTNVHVSFYNFILGILSILLAHSIATIQNDINDYEIDKINSPDKPLTGGKISIKEAKTFSWILLSILGFIAVVGFPKHFFFIFIILLICWLYNNPPFLLSRKTFWPLIILASMYSVVPMLYGYFLKNSIITSGFLCIVMVWFLLRISISILKDFKDEKGDLIFKKKTFYLTYGKNLTIRTSLYFSVVSFILIFYFLDYIRPIWVWFIMMLPAVRSIYLRWKLFKAEDVKLTHFFHQIFFGQNQFDIIFLLWLLMR